LTVTLLPNAAEGVNVHWRPPIAEASVPVTAAPSLTVKVDVVTPITGSEKVATIVVLVATIVAFGAGVRIVTVGAVVSGAVMNIQVTGAASALPARSAIAVVRFTVTAVLAASGAAGVNVHSRPLIAEARVPVTAAPSLTVKLVVVTPITGSLNSTTMVVAVDTMVAPGPGVRVITVGAVVSEAVVNVHVTGAPESALPDVSVMPEVKVAVSSVPWGSAAAGVNVAVRVPAA